MELSSEILSKIVVFSKYARYIPKLKRRETWEEIVERNLLMHIKKFPFLEEEIRKNYQYVFEKKIFPSARSLQYAGKAIEIAPQRIFNCSAVAISDWRAFHEIMFLLLLGCGVGISVQKHHIENLPIIRKPLKRKRRYLIQDSVEGWADSVKVLMKSYFYGSSEIEFDFRAIREKGAKIKSGGFAPGSQPLKDCLHNIKKVLDLVEIGEKITPFQAHQIVCYISDAVLSGGVRRSSCISIFSLDDKEMLYCKNGRWWDEKPHLARANNSAMLMRHKISKEVFDNLWSIVKNNKTGEPGFYFSNDSEYLLNPCGEANLRTSADGCGSFCNLVEINLSLIDNQEELNKIVTAASFIGTLQATYTDFHYLREGWKRNTEKDALLGIGITGLADKKIYNLDFKTAAKIAIQENERVANILNIKAAARLNVVKPSGTISLLAGCSSGIHPYFAKYYIRRIRFNKDENLYKFLVNKIPNLIEDDFEKPMLGAIVSIPIKVSDDAIVRSEETAINFLERVKYVYQNWIVPGHKKGSNTHSVSCTVSIKEKEWDEVGKWLWDNKEFYNCISVLPYDGGEYLQMPFEEISKEKYEEMFNYLKDINLSEVIECDDMTKTKENLACSANGCEILNI